MAEKMKILLVEDDANFGMLLKNYLELSNYEVDWAKDGAKGYSMCFKIPYDLCILDVMMPNMDGLSLAQKIRSKYTAMPIFFLTAKNAHEDVLAGYKAGGDDYLTKPFETDILLLKIKALFERRVSQNIDKVTEESYEFGMFTFQTKDRLLKWNQEERKLSPKEAHLLSLLCMHQNNILQRSEALIKIWGEENYFTKRSMDVYITKLRKYLAVDKNISIDTFHQVGFQLYIRKD
jgi:DNA-binding response OmpR family regulator